MNLLIATDHRFLEYNCQVYDTSTYDSGFFKDYLEAFEHISVVCRMTRTKTLPRRAFRSECRNVRFIPLPDIHGLLWALAGDRIATPRARKAVREADALIARVPGQAGWAAARFVRKQGKPYMVEVAGDPREAIRNLGRTPWHTVMASRYEKQLRSLAKHAAAASYVTSCHLPVRYPVEKSAPFQCISDIRLAPGQIAEPREYRRNGGSPLRVIMVANLVPYKRHQDLLHATRKAVDGGANVEVRFAGDGPCRQRLEKLSEELELADRVRFHGHISDRKALMDLLDASDLFALTSGTEGLPRAMIEAMARGLPVIASRAGGVLELVNDAELFPVGDVDALTRLIRTVSHDSRRLTRLSAENIDKVRAFTSEKLSSKRVELYRFLREKAAASSAFGKMKQ